MSRSVVLEGEGHAAGSDDDAGEAPAKRLTLDERFSKIKPKPRQSVKTEFSVKMQGEARARDREVNIRNVKLRRKVRDRLEFGKVSSLCFAGCRDRDSRGPYRRSRARSRSVSSLLLRALCMHLTRGSVACPNC